MHSESHQRPILGSCRSVFLRLFAGAVSVALGACGATDNPLAPTAADEALAPASESAAPDYLLTGTSQRILFSSSRKGGYDMFKSDPQGDNVVGLTSFATPDGGGLVLGQQAHRDGTRPAGRSKGRSTRTST